MTVGNPAVDPAFDQIRELRPLLLKAHKHLMEAEKDIYEAAHGPIPHKGEYLRLVLSHEQFSWLRPISQFIVQLDEVLMSKQPQPLARAEELMQEARHLLQATEIGHAFQERSALAAQNNLEMAAMTLRITELLADGAPSAD
ncbi:hypothetical protein GFS31_39190 [Leptolyngbya sp. BL0902]|uniref:hypothetical protein n=1 Tax=Leptolyngbya sp. BL0902 TaxID=1115757 RepID=UPI0018E6FE95|nr:hypothetical protein [Leptolyngbya sp. BL0902]QQE67207.1 hypothetical protein GFS31_39190 [Leptolyngbya sp. BL0902]